MESLKPVDVSPGTHGNEAKRLPHDDREDASGKQDMDKSVLCRNTRNRISLTKVPGKPTILQTDRSESLSNERISLTSACLPPQTTLNHILHHISLTPAISASGKVVS